MEGVCVQGWVCFSIQNTQQSENVGMKANGRAVSDNWHPENVLV